MAFRLIRFGLVVFIAACHRHPPVTSSVAEGASAPYCAMSIAALRASVKSYADQQYGLDSACVADYATTGGKVYVDARFESSRDLETVSEGTCVRDNFVIRFDFEHYEQSPGENVLRLNVHSEVSRSREFLLEMKNSDWPKQRPGVLTIPPCYPAYGVLKAGPKGWQATVTPPPRRPGDL